jgi:WD40 repeat protein
MPCFSVTISLQANFSHVCWLYKVPEEVNMFKKHPQNLFLAMLFVLFLLLPWLLEAAEPLVSIGKPPLYDILYSPDGRFLVTLTPAYVELLDTETFAPITRIDGTDGYKLAFSPDSSLLAVFGSKVGIQIWEVISQRLLETIPIQTEIVIFSPDGKYLAYAEWDSVFLWDIAQKQAVQELTGDPQPQLEEFQTSDGEIHPIQGGQYVTAIAFHPDSRILAVGSIRLTVALWDVQTSEILSYLKVERKTWPKIIQFSHDGILLSVGTNHGGVGLWNIGIEDARHYSPYQGTSIHDLVFTPDDQHLLVGEGDGNLRVIKVATFSEEKRPAVNRLPPPGSHDSNRLERLTFHPDRRKFASLINNSRIVIWDVQSFSRLQTLYGWANDWAQAVYLPKLNRIVTGIYTNELHFWDATTGELIKTSEFYTGIWQLKASPDGRKLAIDAEATNQIWDAETGEPLHIFQIYGYLGTTTIEFSTSGKYLASNTFRGTFVWDTETGEEVNLIDTTWSDFPLLMFTPDEQQILMIPRRQEKVVFWDIQTGQPVREIDHLGPMVRFGTGFLQARDSQDYKALEVFQVETNKRLSQIPKLKPFSLKEERFYNVRFHPSGNILVIRNYDTSLPSQYNFYDSQTGELLSTLFIHDFDFVDKGEYMFITDDKKRLGLYRTSEVLGVPTSVAVEPLGKKFTRWGKVKQNQLLQNYPNPFNPETWIPYQLETDQEVMIRIYNHLGELICVLPLGMKKAGTYLSKSSDAYWNGRNSAGELVASGVYFYTLQAGYFTATKKMLIQE